MTNDVTPYVLNNYIDNKIRSLPPDIRPKQTPLLNCSTSGKIVLAHYPKELKIDSLRKLLELEKIDQFNKLRRESDIPLYLRKVVLVGKA